MTEHGMERGELEDLLDCAVVALAQAKEELKALRESVMELGDEQDCVVEASVGDTGGVVGLCA